MPPGPNALGFLDVFIAALPIEVVLSWGIGSEYESAMSVFLGRSFRFIFFIVFGAKVCCVFIDGFTCYISFDVFKVFSSS